MRICHPERSEGSLFVRCGANEKNPFERQKRYLDSLLRSDVLLRARPKNDRGRRVNCYIIALVFS